MLTSSGGGRSMLTVADRGGGGDKICQNLADVICERSLMCDVISFATPLDGFRERGFVGVTHGPIGFWCSQKLLRHTSFLLSATV